MLLGMFLFSNYSTINGQCTLPIVVGSTVGVPTMSDAVSLGLLVETSGTITSQNFRVAGNFLIDAPRTLINCVVQVEDNGFIEMISGTGYIIRNTQIISCGTGSHNIEIVGGGISIENNSLVRCGSFNVFQSTFLISNSTLEAANATMLLNIDFSTNASIINSLLDKVAITLNNQSILQMSKSLFDGNSSPSNNITLSGQANYLGLDNQFLDVLNVMRTDIFSVGFKSAQEIGSTISRPSGIWSSEFLYEMEKVGFYRFENNIINGLGRGLNITEGNTTIIDNIFNFDPSYSSIFSHPGISTSFVLDGTIINNSLFGGIISNLSSGIEIFRNELNGLPSNSNLTGILNSSSIASRIDLNVIKSFPFKNLLIENSANVSARYNKSDFCLVAYELENTRLALLECNSGIFIDEYGLGVKGNCAFLVHRGSNFDRINKCLEYNIPIVGTGDQINSGNKFFNYNSGGTCVGACNDSEYIVNPSAPEEFPVPFSPLGWFNQNGTSSYQCLSVEEPPYGDPRSLNTETLRTMLDCYSQDMGYNDGLCFSILQSLYSIIDENLDQIEDADLLDFYDNNTYTAIGKLPTSEDILRELQQAKIEMPEVVLNFSIEDIQNHDVVAQFNAEGANWYNSTRDAKNQILEHFRNQILSVSATNEFIQTNIDVTHYLLDYLQLGSGVDYDTTFLSMIASGCVHEHGNAVYLARSICKGLGLDFHRADFGDCMNTFELIQSETIHNANHQFDEPNNSINIYPNPAVDFIHIDKSIEYKIINSVGTIVGEGYSQNGRIDIHVLPIGVYLLQDIAGQKVFKFVKQ